MGLLAGEDKTLLQGDINNLKNEFESFRATHCSDHYEEADKLYPRLNVMEERLRFLQSFMDSLDDRITSLETNIGMLYKIYKYYNFNENEKTNDFS